MTVSSRQVAEKFEKEHFNILRDIEKIKNEVDLNFDGYFFSTNYIANNGKANPEYLMNRDGFSLLAMGFTGKKALEWKIKFIQAFNDMEKQIYKPKELSRLEILTLALEAENKVLELEAVVEVMTPKVEFYDAVTQSDEEFTIQQVVSILANKRMGRNNLFKYLVSKGVLINSCTPYRNQIEAGRFRTVEIPWMHPKTNKINITTQVVATQKGLDYIRKLLKGDGYKVF